MSGGHEYPVGSVIIARFAFTSRPLTDTETSEFLAGNGLPASVGVDPALVFFRYEPPRSTPVELTTSGIVKDNVGEYHAQFALTTTGVWYYRGRGTDTGNNPMAATPRISLLAS